MEEPGVQNVTVKTIKFNGTQNGVRIKSWGRPSNGFANNIIFQNIEMLNVHNPIIIDQNYCPNNKNCPGQVSFSKAILGIPMLFLLTTALITKLDKKIKQNIFLKPPILKPN